MKHKGMRDFFYDKNDFFLALAIIAIAALLIWWRMDSIMDYPQTLAEATDTTDTTADEATDTDKDNASDKSETADKSDSDKEDTTSDKASSTSVWNGDKLAKDTSVTVATGSATSAVQALVDAGLFSSYDDFSSVCTAIGTKAEYIKATTFTFPAGSTREDIAKKVTQ